ncbi:MAG: hypothetical protein AAF802_32155 [Planctomycetota bacterium]
MSTLPPSDAKQPPSVYTVMLVLSMVFLLIAVIAMFVEFQRWKPDYWRTQQAKPTVQVISIPAQDVA